MMLADGYCPKTNDAIIRKALKKKLLHEDHKNDPETIIVEELGLKHGDARVDLAVINGVLHGFELKSDLDTLFRLPGQMKIYNLTLDQITLVVGKDHLVEAMKIIPDWWGVLIAKSVGAAGDIRFYEIRSAENNPSLDNIAIAHLLWRDEALHILEQLGQAKGVRSKSRKVIYERLTAVLSRDELRQIVRKCLSTRINWRPEKQCMLNGD